MMGSDVVYHKAASEPTARSVQLLSICAGATTFAAAALGQGTSQGFHVLSPTGTYADNRWVSRTGDVQIIGRYTSGVGYSTTYWPAAGGALPVSPFPGDMRVELSGLSANGGALVGYSEGTPSNNYFMRAFRWTPNGGTQDLGSLPGFEQSNALSVSGDGNVVAGLAIHAAAGGVRTTAAFRWTAATGMTTLPAPSFAPQGIVPRLTSATGSVIVGSYNNHSHQSTLSNDGVFAWTAGPGGGVAGGRFDALPVVPGVTNAIVWANGINDAGTLVVGSAETVTAGHYSPVVWSRSTLSAPWSVQTLPCTPYYEGRFNPLVVGLDGAVVGGSAWLGGATYRAVLWTPDHLTMDLTTILQQMGYDLGGWQLTSITGMSDDGSQISGLGFGPNGTGTWSLSGLNVAMTPTPGGAAVLILTAATAGRRRR